MRFPPLRSSLRLLASAGFAFAIAIAMAGCTDEPRRIDLPDSATADNTDAARNGFITSFVATAPAGTTEEQAGCVFDELIDDGVEVSEMTSKSLPPNVEAALTKAVSTCGLD